MCYYWSTSMKALLLVHFEHNNHAKYDEAVFICLENIKQNFDRPVADMFMNTTNHSRKYSTAVFNLHHTEHNRSVCK